MTDGTQRNLPHESIHTHHIRKIRYVDLAAQHAPLKAKLLEAIADVIDEGQFILGRQVAEFEEEFAALCGVRHALGLNSGTDALVLALRAVGVEAGDEVITVPNSFVASTACIRLVGARPVFVDVGADYNIDPAKSSLRLLPVRKPFCPSISPGVPAIWSQSLRLQRPTASRSLRIALKQCSQNTRAGASVRLGQPAASACIR